jgi:hypothetical protein
MTKTHCGGRRCVNCPASEYYVIDAPAFAATCERISGFQNHRPFELSSKRGIVAKLIHLIRYPFDNIVARFHLETQAHGGAESSPSRRIILEQCHWLSEFWCSELDQVFSYDDSKFFLPPNSGI